MIEIPEILKPMAWHGVEFDSKSGSDFMADCPFCHKSEAFSASGKTGQWTCHSSEDTCGRKGNVASFLDQWTGECLIVDRKLQELATLRRVPLDLLKGNEIGWNSMQRRWMLPSRNATGGIGGIGTWTPKTVGGKKARIKETLGVPTCLWGWDRLREADGERDVVYICEGRWDGYAMRWLLRRSSRSGVAVALPGARTVKDEWIEELKRFARIVVVGDADADGDAMAKKIWERLQGPGRVIDFVNWPETLPDEWDLTDFVRAGVADGVEPDGILYLLDELVSSEHRRMPFEGQDDVHAAETGERESDRRRLTSTTSLKQVMAAFEKHLEMTDDLRLGLRYCLDVHVAAPWPGDPLWGFIVGAPSSGKSELLMSMANAPDTLFQSSVSRESLISGWAGRKDPSLIPRLIGRCGVFKDWTELCDMDPRDLAKVYALLRGAYDGRVDRTFGNGESRHYIGRFGIIAGTTNDIYKINQSSVGERFLKFQLPPQSRGVRNAIAHRALLSVGREGAKDTALQSVVGDFLDCVRDPPDVASVLDRRFRGRIVALAELVCRLRTSVEWINIGRGDREVSYRPEEEGPARLSKQLTRLAIADVMVRGVPKGDDETWRLVERVGFNTAHGYSLDVVEAIMSAGKGGRNRGRDVTIEDIGEAAQLHRVTLTRRLETLEVTRVVRQSFGRPRRGPGGKIGLWTVVPSVRQLWNDAAPQHQHIHEASAARVREKGDE